MNRRKFIQNSLAGTALLTAFPYELFAGTKKLYPSDQVQLGNTGIVMSRMAMGTGTRGFGGSSNQTRKLGITGVSDLLRAAYDEGINFWETADQYGSHPHIKEAMKKIEREKLVLLTKTNSTTYKDIRSDLDRFKNELGTDYFDIVLLHAITDPEWNVNMKGAMEALSEAKEAGTIRAHGISCHSIGALETTADEPWVDVDLVRYNPGGVAMDADVSTVQNVLTRMKKNGKAIIGMKVYGAGRLVDQKDECLEFHTGAGFLDHFTLGIESYEQLKDIQKRLPEASVRG
ncbi:MAG: aldo/keto reductase [Bacteroides sp. SM1_62]|nr:MAG: aldo/keto reductase [Bacteroides sp. SM23_62]KPL25708.1 MAG: aldo/keto reductase [Bacteroides sp. SM1_62]